jgi:hypothetical protein
MFIMAEISASSVSGPVKICNLSTQGALIEGARLPAADEALELRKGDILAAARVVWTEGGKAGLKFHPPISVSDWMPLGYSGQQAVDATFRQVKQDAAHPPLVTADPVAASAIDPEQLRQAAAALEALADGLAEDAEAVARHGSNLQILDIAAQLMRKLAEPG